MGASNLGPGPQVWQQAPVEPSCPPVVVNHSSMSECGRVSQRRKDILCDFARASNRCL